MIKNFLGIDSTDQKILNILLESTRQTYNQIAKKAKLSKEVVRYRIKNLEKQGILKGYRTLIDYKSLNLQIYELLIKLKKPNKEKERKFIEFLKSSDILGYGLCLGEFDFNIVLTAENNEKIKEFIDQVKKVLEEDIESIDVLININEEYVFHNKIKIRKNIKLTENEKKLIRIMATNASYSLKEISYKINRSYQFIVKTLKKLENSGIIKAYYPDIMFKKIGLSDYSIFIKAKYMNEKDRQIFREYLVHEPSIFWYVEYIGKYDYGIEVIVKNSDEFREKLNNLISRFGNKIIEIKHTYIKLSKK